MDPITITTTVITIASVFKDALELVTSLKESVEKISSNKDRLIELVNDIYNTLSQLEEFYNSHNISDESTNELSSSLQRLRGEMQSILQRCLKVLPRSSSRRFGAMRSKFKAWRLRDDIEEDIIQLRERIVAYHCYFTALTAARIEHTAIRTEQLLLLHREEHRSTINRLEVLVANVFMDTKTAQDQTNLRHISRNIAPDPNKQGIEAQYLRLKVSNLAIGISRGLSRIIGLYTEEKVRWLRTPFSPSYTSVISDDRLILNILQLSCWLEGGGDYYPIFQIGDIAIHLHRAALYSEALALNASLVQILRVLVVNDTFRFLPRLAFSLHNLAIDQMAIGSPKDAQSTLQSAIASIETVTEQYPDFDFRDLATFISSTHASMLASTEQFDECIRVARHASADLVALLADVKRVPETGLTYKGRDSSLIITTYRTQVALAESLCATGSFNEAFSVATKALQSLLLLPRGHLKCVGLDHIPLTALKVAFSSLTSIYRSTGGPLSLAEEGLLLYRDLIKQQPERFSLHFLRTVFAFSYLCHIKAENDNLKLRDDHCDAFGSLNDGRPTNHCHFGSLITYLNKRTYGRDVIQATILTFLTFDRRENLVPDITEEELGELVCTLIDDNIPIGVEAFRQSILYYRDNWDKGVCKKAFTMALRLSSEFTLRFASVHISTFLPILAQLHTIAGKESTTKDENRQIQMLSAELLTAAIIRAGKFIEARALSRESPWAVSDTSTHFFDVMANLASEWFTMGQLDDTLQCISDGILMAKKELPITDNEHLCSCLNLANLSASILDSLGFEEERAIILEEALRLYPAMHHTCRKARRIVANLAGLLLTEGKLEAALEISKDAMDIPLTHFHDDFDQAYAYDIRSKCLAALGKHEEALKVAEEGMEYRRKGTLYLSPRKVKMDAHNDSRALAYCGYADRLARVGRTTEALAVVDEAIQAYRSFEKVCIGIKPALASALEQRSQLLWKLERKEEAAQAAEDVIKIRRSIGGKFFKEHVLLPTSLERLAGYFQAIGKPLEAAEAKKEAVSFRARIDANLETPPTSQQAIVAAMMECFPQNGLKRFQAHFMSKKEEDATSKVSSLPTTSPSMISFPSSTSTATVTTSSSSIPLPPGLGRLDKVKRMLIFLVNLILVLSALVNIWAYVFDNHQSFDFPSNFIDTICFNNNI